jgi:hypothetical protein
MEKSPEGKHCFSEASQSQLQKPMNNYWSCLYVYE